MNEDFLNPCQKREIVPPQSGKIWYCTNLIYSTILDFKDVVKYMSVIIKCMLGYCKEELKPDLLIRLLLR